MNVRPVSDAPTTSTREFASTLGSAMYVRLVMKSTYEQSSGGGSGSSVAAGCDGSDGRTRRGLQCKKQLRYASGVVPRASR